jgi:hypothetical protein
MDAAGPAVLGAEVERLDARLCLRGAVGDNVDDDDDVAPDESEWEEERLGCSAAAAASAAKASASAALNESGAAFSISMSMLIFSIPLGPLLWRKFDSERRRRTRRRRDLVCSLVIEKDQNRGATDSCKRKWGKPIQPINNK